MYRIAVLAEEKLERQYYAGDNRPVFVKIKDISKSCNTANRKVSLKKGKKIYAYLCHHCTSWSKRTKCSGDIFVHYVPHAGLSGAAIWIFLFTLSDFVQISFTKASFRRSLSAGIKYLD